MYDVNGKLRNAQDPTVEIQNAPVSRELKYQVSFMQNLSFWKIHWPEIERSQGHLCRSEKMQNFGFTLRWGHFR